MNTAEHLEHGLNGKLAHVLAARLSDRQLGFIVSVYLAVASSLEVIQSGAQRMRGTLRETF